LKITGCQLEAEKATRKEEADKRALSSYNVFMKTKPTLPFRTKNFREVAAKWSATSMDQKAQYA
jgi:hypothetical protein